MAKFITGAKKDTSTHQTNKATDAKLLLTPQWNDYTFNKQVYAPLLHKMVIRLAIMDIKVTDQQLCDSIWDLAS